MDDVVIRAQTLSCRLRKPACVRSSARPLGGSTRQHPKDTIPRKRQLAETHPGRIGDRVDQRRCHRIERALAHRLRAERANAIHGVGKQHLGARQIGPGGDVIATKRRVLDATPASIRRSSYSAAPIAWPTPPST